MKHAYKNWICRNRGTVIHGTFMGNIRYFTVLLTLLLAKIIAGVDMFQVFMQFLMTFTSIQEFAEDNWMHASTSECDVVTEYPEYDSSIAFYTTIIAYMMIVPVVYEISKILIPGLNLKSSAFFTDYAFNYVDVMTNESKYSTSFTTNDKKCSIFDILLFNSSQ